MSAEPLHELWERIFPHERRWLSWLIILALLAHILLFVFLKVRQMVQAGAKPPLLQSTALTDSVRGSEIAYGGKDLIWLDWLDPSAPILPRGQLPALPAMDLVPKRSGVVNPAQFPITEGRLPDVLGLNTELPSIVQQVQSSLTAFHPVPREVQIETPPQLSGTVVELSGDLAGRGVVQKTELAQPEVDRNLRTTACLIGVNARGIVENVLVDSSCDDPAIDQLAVQELKNWRFAAVSDKGLQWGKAIVYWHFKGKTVVPPAGGNP